MSARVTPEAGSTSGNFISEWFGHRVWPTVDDSASAVSAQTSCSCPFLSAATGADYTCIKTARGMNEPTGVCSISSDSNGTRQDWLACPYRTLDQHFTLLGNAVRSNYRVPATTEVVLFPVNSLDKPARRTVLARAIKGGSARVFIFTSDKLGGEVDIPETDVSPGSKVDVSVIEVTGVDGTTGEPTTFGKHMFYEIQTADFHGSPLHAVRELRSALPRKRRKRYHDNLKRSVELAGRGVEGPNKANIFKRTIYQMILKIQLSEDIQCAGFTLVLPLPVWDSWLRHLGRPELVADSTDPSLVRLLPPGEDDARVLDSVRAWILVFDIDGGSRESPQPLKIVNRVATSSVALVHYTFQTAAEKASEMGVLKRYRAVLESRVREGWEGKRT